MCGNGATRSLRTAFNTKAYRAAASGADTRPSRNPRHVRMFGEWLLVVGPHPQDVDNVAIREHLMDKSVLDVDAP